jgi:predicted ester cyclase
VEGRAVYCAEHERVRQQIDGERLREADSSLQHAHVVRAVAGTVRELLLGQMCCAPIALEKGTEARFVIHCRPYPERSAPLCTALYEKCTSQFVDTTIAGRHAGRRTSSTSKGARVMAIDTNKALVRRYYDEVLGQGNIHLLEEIAVLEYEEHDPIPGQTTGLEGLKQRVEILRSAFQPRFTLEDVVAEGDRVVVRWTNRGVHVGEFMGIPPTGRSFSIAGIDIHRLSDGKMVEHWHVVDLLGQLQQLGLIPQPAESAV